MNFKALPLIAVLLGFASSTTIAMLNGYMPGDIYGYNEYDLVAENRQLLVEAKQLKRDLDLLNLEKSRIVTELEDNIAAQKGFNQLMQSSILSIADIIKKGETNEKKIRSIAKAINEIGNNLIGLSTGAAATAGAN